MLKELKYLNIALKLEDAENGNYPESWSQRRKSRK